MIDVTHIYMLPLLAEKPDAFVLKQIFRFSF